MAWTTTKKHEYAAGNVKVQLWTLSADSATLELTTGLKWVDHANLTVMSGVASQSSQGIMTKLNKNSTNVSSAGMVSITGTSSGNELLLTVYGH